MAISNSTAVVSHTGRLRTNHELLFNGTPRVPDRTAPPLRAAEWARLARDRGPCRAAGQPTVAARITDPSDRGRSVREGRPDRAADSRRRSSGLVPVGLDTSRDARRRDERTDSRDGVDRWPAPREAERALRLPWRSAPRRPDRCR